MTKKFVIFVIFLLTLTVFESTKHVVRGDGVVSNQVSDEILAMKLDPEAKVLAKYLADFDSPLQFYAQDLVDAAKAYGLDWKMLPAIAGVESTFGKNMPGGYNAWGWGVYGNQAVYFGSWREAIFTIAKSLREDYLDKGLTEPYSISRAYATSPYWGGKVSYFMNELESYAKIYRADSNLSDIRTPTDKVAATSGLIALR